MVFTVSLNRFQGFLRRTYGASASDVVFAMWVVEETLELLIPLLFLAALPRRNLQPVTLTRRAAAWGFPGKRLYPFVGYSPGF